MKYMGSKSRITKYIVPIIQYFIDESGYTTYYEPFVGSASVIDKIKCSNRIGSDVNKYLIGLLNHVKYGGLLADEVSKEEYDKVRDFYNGKSKEKYSDWYVGNIGFLASYNGRFFDGGYAKPCYEKTKNGERYRDYYKEAKHNLEKQAKNLKGIELFVSDINDWDWNKLENFNNTVFYFDPPYKNTKQYGISKNFDYDKFYNICRRLSCNNIAIVSEENMPDDFTEIWHKPVSRSIKSTDKSYSTEKLFIIGKALDFWGGKNDS